MGALRAAACLAALVLASASHAQTYPSGKRAHRRALSAGRSDRHHRAPLRAKTLRGARATSSMSRTSAERAARAARRWSPAAPADGRHAAVRNQRSRGHVDDLIELQYDPIKSFAPVGLVSSSPSVVAGPSFGAGETLQELIQLARADPAKYSFASMSSARTSSPARSSSGSG